MDAPDFFRSLERVTLRRDELLRKLREQVDSLNEGEGVVRVLATLKSLRRSRRTLNKILNNASISDIEKEYSELVATLAQFTLLVALKDEEELISEVLEKLKSLSGRYEEELSSIESDLKEIKELEKTVNRFLGIK